MPIRKAFECPKSYLPLEGHRWCKGTCSYCFARQCNTGSRTSWTVQCLLSVHKGHLHRYPDRRFLGKDGQGHTLEEVMAE